MKGENYQGAGLYQHFKGGLYMVIGTASHSTTHELLVLYVLRSKGDTAYRMWVRPLKEFNEWKEIDGQNVPRFRKVRDDNDAET